MNTVHVVIGKRRHTFGSMSEAIRAIKARVIAARALGLIEDEILEMLKQVFLIE